MYGYIQVITFYRKISVNTKKQYLYTTRYLLELHFLFNCATFFLRLVYARNFLPHANLCGGVPHQFFLPYANLFGFIPHQIVLPHANFFQPLSYLSNLWSSSSFSSSRSSYIQNPVRMLSNKTKIYNSRQILLLKMSAIRTLSLYYCVGQK